MISKVTLYDSVSGFRYVETNCVGNLFGIQSEKGKTIVPCNYKVVWYDDGVFLAEDSQGYVSCYKSNGKCIIGADKWYRYIAPFIINDKLIGYEVGKEKFAYGICNTKGKQIIPPLYDKISYFKEQNTFLVKRDTLYGVISSSGKEVVPIKYPKLHYDSFLRGYFFKGPHGSVKTIDGEWEGDEWMATCAVCAKILNSTIDEKYVWLRIHEIAERQFIQTRNAESFANIVNFATSVATAALTASSTSSGSYDNGSDYSALGSDVSPSSSDSSYSNEDNTKTKSFSRVCTMCNGTGKVIKSSGAPQFGLREKYCEICGKKVPGDHIHGQCPACRGKGHM